MNHFDRTELEEIRRQIERYQRMLLLDREPERLQRHEQALERLSRRYAERRAELA